MDKVKVFLVDDEYLERTLLRYSVPWDDLGFEIVGEAGSGEEMMEKVKSANARHHIYRYLHAFYGWIAVIQNGKRKIL